MKKIIAMVLCFALVVGFTGCTDKVNIDDINPPTNVMAIK